MKRVAIRIETAEDERDFDAFLKAHPGVSTEKPNYGVPGSPMSQDELADLLDESRRQAQAGDVTDLAAMRKRAAERDAQ